MILRMLKNIDTSRNNQVLVSMFRDNLVEKKRLELLSYFPCNRRWQHRNNLMHIEKMLKYYAMTIVQIFFVCFKSNHQTHSLFRSRHVIECLQSWHNSKPLLRAIYEVILLQGVYSGDINPCHNDFQNRTVYSAGSHQQL